MVVEALVADRAAGSRSLRRLPEEAQRGQQAIDRGAAGDKSSLYADGIGGQREADGRNAGSSRRRVTVARQPVFGVRRLPEEAECALLDVVDERLVQARSHVRKRA